MKDYEKEYNTFWKDIVENEDGSINKEQIMKELFDYSYFIENIPKLYDNISGGYISKPMTNINAVIQKVEERIEQAYEEGYEEGYNHGSENA